MKRPGKQGFTLLEMMIVIAVVSLIALPVARSVQQSVASWRHVAGRKELLRQGTFAMERMTDATRNTRRLLLPLVENPLTPQKESIRNVLAVTIDPYWDRNGDGFMDADNDKDGLVDEDIPPDNTNDNNAGIIGIDDDNDGMVDEGGGLMMRDNDEDGILGEDWLNGKDDDGDGSVDEDIPADNKGLIGSRKAFDNDGDGRRNEDWLDPVVFFVNPAGNALIERLPLPESHNGNQYTERIIAAAVKIILKVERRPITKNGTNLVEITLELRDGEDEPLKLRSLVRAGGMSR